VSGVVLCYCFIFLQSEPGHKNMMPEFFEKYISKITSE